MDICLATDDNYARYCATVIISGIKNKNKNDKLTFHIIHGGLKQGNIEKLEGLGDVVLHKVDDEIFAPYLRKAKLSWPTSTLYRLKCASILNLDKVIYLDCDVIIRSSLNELWNEDIENYYAGVIQDVYEAPHIKRLGLKDFYFNAGVMVMNLKKIREDGIEAAMFDYLAENYQDLIFNDQDVLNYVLEGNVKKLDKKFNFIPYAAYQPKVKRSENYTYDAVIAHHAGVKPWGKSFSHKLREEFWNYYALCPFLGESEYKNLYKKYLASQTKFKQILLYLKQRPFAFFTKRRQEVLEIAFD